MAKNRLVAFFGADKDISTITKADVTELKAGLLEKYAEATVGRTLKRGKQFFAHAVDSKIMDVNPFDKVRVPGQSNKERMYFVNREVSKKVLDACPDKWWRLIFSLARFGGLRIPSELVGLKWSDILWDRERIRIESPKTARIGKGERLIPMFPELKGILQECFEAASEKAIYIFDRKITAATNLRKRLFGIIRNSGEKPWPKLFQNLRASRETELAGEYPIHVTTSWLGNSPAVAMAHYLQVTDADFLKASMGVSISGDMRVDDHSKSVSLSTSLDAKTTQNPSHRGGSQVFAEVQQLLENPEVMKNLTVIAGELQNGKMTSLGLEPRTPALKVPCSTS